MSRSMAVIGRRLFLAGWLLPGVALRADQAQDALQIIGQMTSALGDNDAVAAMSVFDPACPQYNELSNCLSNLVTSYLLTNEADVVDEDEKPDRTSLVLDWTLTLRSQSTDQSVQRRQEVHVALAKRKGTWKIVTFSPTSLFSPNL